MTNEQNIWWRQYRRSRFITTRKMSREMIIRKSFKETSSEYLKNCAISGINYIYDPDVGLFKRIFWILVFGGLLATLIFLLHSIWLSLNIPLIVSMESTTHPIAEIDFPAVVLCNVNRLSQAVVTRVAQQLIIVNKDNKKQQKRFNESIKSLKDVEWNVIQLGRLIDFEFSVEIESQIVVDFGDRQGYNTRVIGGLMRVMAPRCDTMFLRCMWDGQIEPCENLFELRRTSRGFCCAFNYVLNDGEYDYDPSIKVKRQKVAGNLHGLAVVMDPQVEDYAYPLHHMKGFDILLFDPKHYPDSSGGRTVHRFIEINEAMQLELQSRTQLATAEVRKYSPKTRNCLFEDERFDEYKGMYSMSSCITRCRIRTLQSLCKCTPFFLPLAENDTSPVCTLVDLHCLNKFKQKFLYLFPTNPDTTVGLEQEMEDSLFCPECLPDCEHTQHYTRSNSVFSSETIEAKVLRSNLTSGINITDKCFLMVYQSTPDGTLDRLDIVLYWYELLSNFGGYAGVLLGLSIATASEWLFFFIIYFAQSVYRKIVENRLL